MRNEFDRYSLRESGSLGACGCVDYHMADCPTRRVVALKVNFGTMGVDEDPDGYDRLRDLGYFDDERYTGVEPWQ